MALLLPPDQETGVSGICGNQVPVCIAYSLESLAGTPGDLLVLVPHDGRCVAVAASDRRDDAVLSVAKKTLSE